MRRMLIAFLDKFGVLAFIAADRLDMLSAWFARQAKRFPDRTGQPIGWWECFFLIGFPPTLAVFFITTDEIWMLRTACVVISIFGGIEHWKERVALAKKEKP